MLNICLNNENILKIQYNPFWISKEKYLFRYDEKIHGNILVECRKIIFVSINFKILKNYWKLCTKYLLNSTKPILKLVYVCMSLNLMRKPS